MLEVPNDRGVFRLETEVVPADIDEQNHVNNVVYLRWVQEVAFAHWNTMATPEMKTKCRWVVLRHEIDYHAPAFLGERIVASTWIDVPEGPRQRRFVSIRRSTDQKPLASACTSWCLLEALTGRPRRVTPEITSVFGLKN